MKFLVVSIFVLTSLRLFGQDSIPPRIDLLGEPGVSICVWTSYFKAYNPGYWVVDNHDSSKDIKIETEGNYELNKLGLFHLRYKATDLAGNVGYSPWRMIEVYCGDRGFECSCKGVGLDESDAKRQTNIYPNPAVGSFTVSLNSPQSPVFTLADALGRVIHCNVSKTDDHTWSVSLGNSTPGIYFLRTQVGASIEISRIVVSP